MPWQGVQAVEVPVLMTWEQHVRARAAFYRLSGAPRDDAALPLPSVHGGAPARRITGVRYARDVGVLTGGDLYRQDAPADDAILELAAYREGPEPTRTEQPAPVLQILPKGVVLPPPPARVVPDVAKFVAVLARPRLENEVWGIRPKDRPPLHIDLYPTPIRPELVGAFAIEDDMRHGRALLPSRSSSPSWWAGSARAAERTVFMPTMVLGNWRHYVAAELVDLGAEKVCLIREDHPWIPKDALPPAAGPLVTLRLTYHGEGDEVVTLRPVRSRVLLLASGKRQWVAETPNGVLQGGAEHESGNLLDRIADVGGVAGEAIRVVTRSAALQIAAAVISGGVGLAMSAGLAQAGAAAAGNFGLQLGGVASVQAAAVAGTQGAPVGGADPIAQRAFDAIRAAAPDALRIAPAAAPDEVNALLAELAKGTAYLAGFDTFYGALFRELTLASLTEEERDRLRVALAELRARVAAEGGLALGIARTVYSLVRSIVISVATAGIGTAAELALEAGEEAAERLYEALEARNAIELQRIMRERVQGYMAREIDRLLDELNRDRASDASEGADPSRRSGATDSRREALYDGSWFERALAAMRAMIAYLTGRGPWPS